MGKVGKKIVGAVVTVAGVALGVFTGQWSLAVAVMSIGVGMMTAPPPLALEERQGAILQNRTGAREYLPVVYGTAKLGPVMADIRVNPNSGGSNSVNSELYVVAAWCHGSRDGNGITDVERVWFDDRLACISSGTIGPEGDSFLVPQDPYDNAVIGGLAAIMSARSWLGTYTQEVDPLLNRDLPTAWPVEAQGRGVAYSVFRLLYSAEIYPNGLPEVTALVQGNKVYDPRDATWKFSTNPVLCILDYLLSPIYGVGAAEASIDEQSFIDMANYCDEMVQGYSGLQKRFELNGWVDTSRSVEQNLAELCTACRGQVVNEGDKWRIFIRRERPVSGFRLTEENTVEGSWQFALPGTQDTPNVVRATYVSPDADYAVDTIQWPPVGTANPYLTADNDYEVRLEIDLPFTTDKARAEQLAMTLLKEARAGISTVCELKEAALQIRIGDLVAVTRSTPGWEDKIFDVAALLLKPNAQVQAVLIEYDPAVYDLDAQLDPGSAPDTDLPDPFTVPPPSSLVLTSHDQALQTNDGRYIPRIRATWVKAAHPFVDYYEIQAKRTADTEWDAFGRIAELDDALFYVYPVTDEQWDVRIRAVNTIGRKSDWLTETHLVTTPDPRPQILSVTLTSAHADLAHEDAHSDVAHADAGHADTHSDTAHTDHTDHSDTHGDAGLHSDAAHQDVAEARTDDGVHCDVTTILGDICQPHQDVSHGDHSDGHTDTHSDSNHSDTAHIDQYSDNSPQIDPHADSHSDSAHADHTDSNASHSDTAHADTHTDSAHTDTAHGDGHTDTAHTDGSHGVGVAIQADTDSASVRAVAVKHSDVAHSDHTDGAHSDVAHADITDPTDVQVRTQPAFDGRNVVIELIDAATGSQIVLDPGDRVRVGALAYSATAGGGVEGPLALASIKQYTVAPVGTDKWVPTD